MTIMTFNVWNVQVYWKIIGIYSWWRAKKKKINYNNPFPFGTGIICKKQKKITRQSIHDDKNGIKCKNVLKKINKTTNLSISSHDNMFYMKCKSVMKKS